MAAGGKSRRLGRTRELDSQRKGKRTRTMNPLHRVEKASATVGASERTGGGGKARTPESCTQGGSLAVIMAEQGRQSSLLPVCNSAWFRKLTIDLEGMEGHSERGKKRVGWRVG